MLKSIKKTATLNSFKEKNAISLTKFSLEKIMGGASSYKPNKHLNHIAQETS